MNNCIAALRLPSVQFALRSYALLLTILTAFRLLLFISVPQRLAGLEVSETLYAFFMGWRFDTVVACYVLVLPFLSMALRDFLTERMGRWLISFAFWFVFVGAIILFWGSAADIPFFNQFFMRLNVTALEWADSPLFVLSMIFQEWRYALYFVLFLAIVTLFFFLHRKNFRKVRTIPVPPKKYAVKAAMLLSFFLLLFIGIRGRFEEKSPIRIGTAYFSENAFLNQLGLNPSFTFLRSVLDKRKEKNEQVSLMPPKKALEIVQESLGITHPIAGYPIARTVPARGKENRKNVVLVLMESMSAGKMRRHGNTKNLTPFLDSLAERSLYFENIYTAGTHTFNGVFSTLFSFPALFRQHPMKESTIRRYNGIGGTLKESGYSTSYFTTHDGQFDNIEGFLRANGFEHIFTKADYPSEKIHTTLGVSDDYLFEFAIPHLTKRVREKKPFLAVFLTAADHGPYFIPDYFHPSAKDIKDQIVQYADWSIRKFLDLAQKEAWSKNTLFVFIADHGGLVHADYEIPLTYVHSPLIFFQGDGKLGPKVFSQIGGQIDVFPTIMGLLNLPYTNNTMGIDLLREKRPYIFFNGDDKFGTIDNEWLLIEKKDKTAKLYKYRNRDMKDYFNSYAGVRTMQNYTRAHLQTYQYFLEHPQMLYLKQR